jgi:gliding motility-associated-like protein
VPVEAFRVLADISIDSLFCLGEVDFFNPADTFGLSLNYDWDFGNGETSTNSEETIDYQNPGTYNISLSVTNADSGCDDAVEETLIVQPNPLLDYLDSLICEDDLAFIEFKNLNDNYSYILDPDAMGITELNQDTTIQIDPLIIQYTITVEDQFGCMSLDTLSISIEASPDIPNLFSPNGDNHNDFFDIIVAEKFRPLITVETFKVYNRWGNLLYDNETPAVGWDGRLSSGDVAPAEIYTYVIKLAGVEEIFKGTVTLIK